MTGQNVGAGKYDRAQEANYVAAKGCSACSVSSVLLSSSSRRPSSRCSPTIRPSSTSARSSCGTSRCRSGSSGSAGVHRRFPRCRQNTDRCCNLNCRTRRHPTSRRIRGLTRRAPDGSVVPWTARCRGIWIAFFASNVVGAGIAWLWFRRGTWRDGDVRGTSSPSGPELDDADATAGDD